MLCELLWRLYSSSRDYQQTKRLFEDGLSKADDLLHRLEVRERLGWDETERLDIGIPLNPEMLIEAAGRAGRRTCHLETEESLCKRSPRRNSL